MKALNQLSWMVDLYIFSKPLQYVNLCEIDRADSGYSKVLVILPGFKSWKSFHEILEQKTSLRWSKVVSIETSWELFVLFFKYKVNEVFVDMDGRLLYGILYLFGRFRSLSIVEEGFGTYIKHVSAYQGGVFKKIIRKMLGVSYIYGNSKYCRNIYVYHPELLGLLKPDLTSKTRRIKRDLLSNLSENKELELFFKLSIDFSLYTIKNLNILIYASNWIISDKVVRQIEINLEGYDQLYIKPHPHIKFLQNFDSIEVLPGEVMLEYLVLLLYRNCNSITIIHESSTSVLNLLDIVTDINISAQLNEDYLFIYKYYLDNAYTS